MSRRGMWEHHAYCSGAVLLPACSVCTYQSICLQCSNKRIVLTCPSILTSVLFVCISKTHQPFSAHLFGRRKSTQPYLIPPGSKHDPMSSEMSFKCQSHSSLSALTLIPSASDSKLEAGLFSPPTNTKAFGLGIYTPRASMPSFLTPRPSLALLRASTTLGPSQPPLSPVLLLPAYFPTHHQAPSAMNRAIYPPKKAYPLRRNTDGDTARLAPLSQTLIAANLKASRSASSLSSVYSRDISGEGKKPLRFECTRSLSSESRGSRKRSPLGAMRLADEPDIVVLAGANSRFPGDGSEDQIDDAAALQASLARVQEICGPCKFDYWTDGKARTVREVLSYHERPGQMDGNGKLLRLDTTPLTVCKTRRSGRSV